MKRFILHAHRARPLNGFENSPNLAENRIRFADNLRWKFHLFLSEPGSARFAKVTVKWVYGMEFP